ncbi:TonB-dependent receptor plug domain-containing protein [Psychroserpens sp. NJDZ02]|uniref:TonB-dependent receptor plug domain-containing protein n=1 Tax=Psychroserpens sp. NJDZ02 TaxID=2570561 RepID=UPI0010A9445D|nr:TonB-dependent receptor [Psychroserpens sp. NJDZ02]QCE42235.1 TonB-dependent receptor [Psychroserpens sp. NJDZ02]
MKKTIVLLLSICYSVVSFAQTQIDSIQYLDEIELSDIKLKHNAAGFKVTVLNDSVLSKNQSSFTDLLRFNSNLYFKENGYGMVSSPSFRGTNASQTAVIWNGININSQLNGQTDFSTINTNNINQVVIRNGGGSVQYGSGAIGGSVHLNNNLNFSKHLKNDVKINYGSFETKNISLVTDYGQDKFAFNLGLNYIDSENDYKYLNSDQVNENGAFNNLSLNVNLGYFISEKDVIKLYHQSFIGDRDFSGTTTTPSKSKFEDINSRSMLEWVRTDHYYKSNFKVAYLKEYFEYYQNQDSDFFTFGQVNTFLVKHNFNYKISKRLSVTSILDYNTFKGEGSSFGNPDRSIFSATGLLQYNLNSNLNIGFNVRQDVNSDFKSPLLFSVDALIGVTEYYKIKINGSKNYRIPTFNDLFWQPGGNLDLVPESSYQIDLGHVLDFDWLHLQLNTYYIKSKNLIQWKPSNSGFWSPQNIAEAHSYGLELGIGVTKKINNHQLKLSSNYSYTVSENLETKKQLIYVPFHKANATIAYCFKRLSTYYQHLFNGSVFTTSDNLEGPFYSLESFNVSNFGVNYKVLQHSDHQIDLGLKVNNVFNKLYQNVAFRPMPNRNFNIQLHYKF